MVGRINPLSGSSLIITLNCFQLPTYATYATYATYSTPRLAATVATLMQNSRQNSRRAPPFVRLSRAVGASSPAQT